MKISIIKSYLNVIILCLIFFIPIWSSGQKDFYIPKALITPVLTHNQELHISLGFGGGYDANITYSLSNHFAVFASGTLNKGVYRRTSLFGDKYKIYKNDYAIKEGIGYFTLLNKPILKHYNVFETYLGFGNYKADNYCYFIDDPDVGFGFTKAKYWNIFWQFNLSEKRKKHESTAAIRLAYSRYTDLQFWDAGGLYPTNINCAYKNLWGITIDPVISYSYLLNRFKLNAQGGISFPLTSVGVTQIDSDTYLNQTTTLIVDNVSTHIGLLSLVGRISVQYNFNFKKAH